MQARIPEAADDRSVDVDERRESPCETQSGHPAIAGTSSVQKAQHAYARHVTRECLRCRDIDRQRCDDGERLYRVWIAACDEAYQKIACACDAA
jgi:hypothetical protein